MKSLMENELEKSISDLWDDYLSLGEKYQDKMPIYEFGVCMIKFASQMLYDCAPSEDTATKAIQAALYMGYELHKFKK